MRRVSSISSGENADKVGGDGDEIFSSSDCVNSNDKFFKMQIQDTHGKYDIDEKMVAEVTGAKEVLKKQKPKRGGGLFGDANDGEGINIFEVL